MCGLMAFRQDGIVKYRIDKIFDGAAEIRPVRRACNSLLVPLPATSTSSNLCDSISNSNVALPRRVHHLLSARDFPLSRLSKLISDSRFGELNHVLTNYGNFRNGA